MEKKSFRSYLKIDKGNLNSEMGNIPVLIYDYGLKQAKIEDEINRVSSKLEITEAKIAANKRVNLTNVNKGNTRAKFTEKTITDQVKIHPEVIEIKEQLIELRKVQLLAKLKVRSLVAKKEMIENIAHNIREEKRSSKKV